jgi:hypothetical protein
VTRGQRHALDVARVPGSHQVAARIGVVLQAGDQLRDLVDFAPVCSLPVAPLMPVDRAKLAVLVGPFVPDANAVLLQGADVGVALQEPQQFVDDRPQVQLLGGQQRKTSLEVETHLPAEHRTCAGSGSICLAVAMFQDMAHQFEVLLHACACQFASAHCKPWRAFPSVAGALAAARVAGLVYNEIRHPPNGHHAGFR